MTDTPKITIEGKPLESYSQFEEYVRELEKTEKETFEIKDLKVGQIGTYKQFEGNSIDDGRQIVFNSFDGDYCVITTDTEWTKEKNSDMNKLKVTNLFVSKQVHDIEIDDLNIHALKLNTFLVKQETEIAELKTRIKKRDNHIALLENYIIEKNKKFTELQEEIQKLKQQLEETYLKIQS